MMKVYRKVVIDLSGYVVEEDSYEYDGPVEEAIGGGGGGRTTTTSVPDPTAQALNRQLGQERQAVVGATGGFAPFTAFNQLALPSAPERSILDLIGGFAGRPAVDPFQQEGLGLLRSATDPTARLAAAREQLESVIGPQIINTLTAAGQGRSGAIAETLGRAGAGLTLPILRDVAQAQQKVGGGFLRFGPSVEQRELGRLTSALGAAEVPRLLEFQETQRPLQILSSLFGPGFIPAGATGGGPYRRLKVAGSRREK